VVRARIRSKLKAWAKALITAAISRLPPDICGEITRQIARQQALNGSIDYQSFLAIAREFNVKSLTVDGDYGLFQSTSSDVGILGAYAASRRWAAETNALLMEFFSGKLGGTYIDVGANIGLTTIPTARIATVHCIAIEPDPTNFRNLIRNIEANCSNNNITALQVAAFSHESILEFELGETNPGDHRIRTSNKAGLVDEHERRVIRVKAAALDDLVGAVEGPLAIKIDTQGAEPFVFKGGSRCLAQADLVILEFWPYGMRRMGGDPEIVLRYLENHFESLSMSHEREPIGPKKPSQQAVLELRRFLDTKASQVSFYLDVFGMRP
jgi:FkbM family methyltransferase